MMQTIEEFLFKYKLTPDCYDTEKIVQYFLSDMKAGLRGECESLLMLPSYISTHFNIIKGKKYVVVDAGGSNFRCGVASIEKGKFAFDLKREASMPGMAAGISAADFYGVLAKYMKSALSEATDIGFCFSYPVQMESSVDGNLVQFTKEIQCSEAEGRKVGASLLKAIAQTDKTPRRVAILNDAVSTLLGGKGIAQHGKFDGFIGFIYGTGINVSYEENVSEIVKVKESKSSDMIINIEAGNFNKLERGAIDVEINANTLQPHMYRLEKMTSGRYMSNIVSRAVVKAKETGLLKGNVIMEKLKILSTKMVSAFIGDINSHNTLTLALPLEQDRETVLSIARSVVNRAAKICSAVIAATVIKSGKGKEKPVAIVAEGTTFNKMPGYREAFEAYLTEILSAKGLKYEVVQGVGLNYIGATLAIMYKESLL